MDSKLYAGLVRDYRFSVDQVTVKDWEMGSWVGALDLPPACEISGVFFYVNGLRMGILAGRRNFRPLRPALRGARTLWVGGCHTGVRLGVNPKLAYP